MDLYAMSSDLEGMKYEETIEAQLAMDEEFKKAGLVALPSEGVSPGVVNLASQYITDQMDKVEEIGIEASPGWKQRTGSHGTDRTVY